MEFLILAVIILGIVAITQLLRIYEVSRELKPTETPVVTEADSKMNARLGLVFLVAFLAFCIGTTLKYKHLFLPEPASVHGVEIDRLFNITMIIIAVPFFICNILLFYFMHKYYYRKDRKATFFAHSNKLEMVWTIIPAVVLSALIIYGLRVWNKVTDYTSVSQNENPLNIELYGKQFAWVARYGGSDNQLGDADFRLINTSNELGLVTKETIALRLKEVDSLINKVVQPKIDALRAIEAKINPPKTGGNPGGHHGGHEAAGHKTGNTSKEEEKPHLTGEPTHTPAPKEHGGHHDEFAGASPALRALADELHRLQRLRGNLADLMNNRRFKEAGNDFLVKSEFHIPLNRPVMFQFRAQDVIHSAYMPHFRAQMNCVPGMKTYFSFIPTITTADMRKRLNKDDFNYILMCNKICGNTHYNMQMTIIVDTPEEYAKWEKEQKTFDAQLKAALNPVKDSTGTPKTETFNPDTLNQGVSAATQAGTHSN